MANLTKMLYVLALQQVAGVGDITAKKLIAHFGSAKNVFEATESSLLQIDGIGKMVVDRLKQSSCLLNAEKELRFIEDENIKLLYFEDDDYPTRLKHSIDGPLLLFQSGNIVLDDRPIISIVGTRKITKQGLAFCEQLVNELKIYNPTIVSGFAYGTDIAAHKFAIDNDLQTIGCLAHGLNQIYPKVHKRYMADVEKNGGFLTDFWSTSNFNRNNFLKRNRIIAGISQATIVIESAEKGGSLVTADIANSYNRDVFAVPGRITDLYSKGCNNLIKQNRAHLLSTPLDVPYILGWELESKSKPAIQKQLFVELSATEDLIYNYLNSNGKQILDVIAVECKMPTFKLAGILITMELKGVVRPLPGKCFEVI